MSGKKSKKFRREIRKMQGALASDLKSWLRDLPIGQRIYIATRIIFRRAW